MSTLSKEFIKIKTKEPYITEKVCKVAKDHHVSLSGLENRIKSWRSAVEKATVRTSLNSLFLLNDMVRYTMVLPEETYGEMVNEIVDSMESYGLYVDKIINYWMKDSVGYNGVNVQLRCKGLRCEVQFHTADSLKVKTYQNHPVYEKYRIEKDAEQKEIYRLMLLEIGKRQRKPAGCDMIRTWNSEKEEAI